MVHYSTDPRQAMLSHTLLQIVQEHVLEVYTVIEGPILYLIVNTPLEQSNPSMHGSL